MIIPCKPNICIQKQPPRGVPRKRCSENMKQIYRRTPLPSLQENILLAERRKFLQAYVIKVVF